MIDPSQMILHTVCDRVSHKPTDLFDKQHSNKVVLLTGFVNGDSTESAQEDVVQSLMVEPLISRKGQDVLLSGRTASVWLLLML
jgi:hypothetical protein